MKHIETQKIISSVFGDELSITEKKHLKLCKECSRKIGLLKKNLLTGKDETQSKKCEKSDDAQLASYVDNRMKDSEKAKYEKHLFSCSSCLLDLRNLLTDMTAFGISPLAPKDKLAEFAGSTIRIMKKGLELVMNTLPVEPSFVYAAAVRGDLKKRIMTMRWDVKRRTKRYEATLLFKKDTAAQLVITGKASKPQSVTIDLLKEDELVERKVLQLEKIKKDTDFGSIAVGTYTLKEKDEVLFQFRVI